MMMMPLQHQDDIKVDMGIHTMELDLSSLFGNMKEDLHSSPEPPGNSSSSPLLSPTWLPDQPDVGPLDSARPLRTSLLKRDTFCLFSLLMTVDVARLFLLSLFLYAYAVCLLSVRRLLLCYFYVGC